MFQIAFTAPRRAWFSCAQGLLGLLNKNPRAQPSPLPDQVDGRLARDIGMSDRDRAWANLSLPSQNPFTHPRL
jgi:hypothetical protein